MKEIPDNIKDAIVDCLQNRATNAQIEQLASWRMASDENELTYIEFLHTWNKVNEALSVPVFKTSHAWENLERRIKNKSEKYKKRDKIIVLTGYSLVKKLAIAAAIFVVLFAVGWLLIKDKNEWIRKEAFLENQDILLTDSSHVILRKGATLTYPVKFSAKERRVVLQGEAFFIVKPDARHPFRIQTPQSLIEVKGTSFLVQANNSVEHVVVASGSVLFLSKKDPSLNCLLKPKQKASFDGKQFSTVTLQDSNYLAWYTRELRFNNKALLEVVNALKDCYKKNIVLSDTALNNILVTGAFREETLVQVLEEVMALSGLQYVQKDSTYIIYR